MRKRFLLNLIAIVLVLTFAINFVPANAIEYIVDSISQETDSVLTEDVDSNINNLPVIDGFHGMGINKLNASHYLKDQTHHNLVGMKLFGEFIAGHLSSSQTMANSSIDTDKVNELINAAIGNAIGGSY